MIGQSIYLVPDDVARQAFVLKTPKNRVVSAMAMLRQQPNAESGTGESNPG
jgi:hypothetical protein